MSLSDLDLVNQAMSAEQARYAPANGGSNGSTASNANGNGSSNPTPAASTPSNPSSAPASGAATAAPDVADTDLSHLTPADRAALQPILDAIKAAGSNPDELDVESILSQMDAAGDAADVLESRLDKLLAHLGELEAQQKE